jgi:hypothetical protein
MARYCADRSHSWRIRREPRLTADDLGRPDNWTIRNEKFPVGLFIGPLSNRDTSGDEIAFILY